MSNQKKKEQQEWNNRAKEIWLAGLGALSAVEEEGGKLFRSLVSRGTEFEKKRKDQINELWDEVSEQIKDVENRVGDTIIKAEETVEENIRTMISGIGVPTKKELNELSQKIDKLAKKLEEISEDKDSGSRVNKESKSVKSKKSK